MKEKLDYKTLRLFPYVIFSMLFAIMISMLSPLAMLFMTHRFNDTSMYQMNNSLFMLCYLFTYLSIVGILSCLYHMTMITKWFGAACNILGGYIIAQAVVYVLKWIGTFKGIPDGYKYFMLIMKLIPTACLMMMIVFVLHGAAEVYGEIDKKKSRIACLKLEVHMIAAFATQMMLNIILSVEPSSTKFTIFYGVLIGIIYLFNISMMFIFYMRIKLFCYDYYLYSYNNQL